MLRCKLNVARNPAAVHKSKLHERELKYNARRADFSVAVFSPPPDTGCRLTGSKQHIHFCTWQYIAKHTVLPRSTVAAAAGKQDESKVISHAHCFYRSQISNTDRLARGILKPKLIPQCVRGVAIRI